MSAKDQAYGLQEGAEKKGKNAEEIMKEMFPFLIYAAIPILLTILIAFTQGSTKQ